MARTLALALLVVMILGTGQAVAQEQEKTIDVVGQASLTARNDTARIAVGVQVRRRTPRAALAAAAARMRRVLARVRAAGVEAGDIQTRGVGVGRVRVGRRGRRRTVYEARNTVTVVIRDVRRVGAVIDAAVAGGATGIGGPDFFVADARALYRQTLTNAFDDARVKAEALAAQAGVTLGPPVSIREEGFDQFGSESSEGLAVTAPGRRPRTPVRPGTTRIRATLFVRFSFS